MNFFGKHCDTLIFANGNAFKYKANSDSYFDFNASIDSVAEYIHKIKFDNFIHISTVDVYDKKLNLDLTKEDVKINVDNLDTYGFHKLLSENYVRKYYPNYLIFRLPGVGGKGLNPVFCYVSRDKKSNDFSRIRTKFLKYQIYYKNSV